MTVMIAEFFGLPHSLVRGGKLKKLNGTAVRLLILLWHESERLCTRELTLTDRHLTRFVKAHRNSLAAARTELKDAGLVVAEPFGPKGFLYQLCNPETGKPWPGPANVKIPYVKKPSSVTTESASQLCQRPKTILNSELAGVNFPFGANAPETQASEQVSKASTPSPGLPWDQIGRR